MGWILLAFCGYSYTKALSLCDQNRLVTSEGEYDDRQHFHHVAFLTYSLCRSPSDTDENNDALNKLISEICNQHAGYNLIIGDFNYPIDWTVHHVNTNDSSNHKFYKTIPKIY